MHGTSKFFIVGWSVTDVFVKRIVLLSFDAIVNTDYGFCVPFVDFRVSMLQ